MTLVRPMSHSGRLILSSSINPQCFSNSGGTYLSSLFFRTHSFKRTELYVLLRTKAQDSYDTVE